MGQPPDANADVRVTAPDISLLDDLVAQWIELAADQRAYDSHLYAGENREEIREAMARHVVTDGIRVAVDSGALVGFVMYDIERGGYDQDVTRGIVRNVYVAPPHRGRGVGTRLLDVAEAELADAGADVVALEAMAANHGAIRFYARRGYEAHRLELEKRLENDTHSKEDR